MSTFKRHDAEAYIDYVEYVDLLSEMCGYTVETNYNNFRWVVLMICCVSSGFMFIQKLYDNL